MLLIFSQQLLLNTSHLCCRIIRIHNPIVCQLTRGITCERKDIPIQITCTEDRSRVTSGILCIHRLKIYRIAYHFTFGSKIT